MNEAKAGARSTFKKHPKLWFIFAYVSSIVWLTVTVVFLWLFDRIDQLLIFGIPTQPIFALGLCMGITLYPCILILSRPLVYLIKRLKGEVTDLLALMGEV